MTGVVLKITNLSKSYSDIVAVDKANLSLNHGEIFGLIGPNGAGKSTLIKMLTTLLHPTSGSGQVAGFDLMTQPDEVRAHIGYVPQLISSDGNLTAYENLLMSARLYVVPRAEREERIRDALTQMNLADAADRLVQHYSGGMIRRLEIAQAMIHNPDILFLDEPTVGLDPIARHNVWQHIKELKAKRRMTILLTTHQMDEADFLCDRIGIMHAGRLERVGTPDELKHAIGPNATLDDVFVAIAGVDIGATESLRQIRRTRASAAQNS